MWNIRNNQKQKDMGSIADLNIRLGADLRGLRRDLQTAERALKQTGERLGAIGREMSMSITAPLIGIAGLTVKAAGEFEQLRLAMRATFDGAGRSMQEADKELEALRQSAMAPGLDFEQAVKGSIRLQNVGISAEKARGTIEQLANAIATTGGTADDLDEVTRQMSQMIANGTVLNADLKILKERMPIIARLMQDTWGTSTADGIRNAGVSAREFVDTITAKMKDLPRVEGGISNTFVNLGASIRQFAVTIGEDLNKSLNLKKTVESLSAWLDGLAQKFRELTPDTKNWIVNIALFAAAAGPVIYAMSLIVKGAAAMKAAFLLTSGAILDMKKAVVGAAAWFTGLFQTINNRASFEALNARIAATTATMRVLQSVAIVGLIAGIAALSYAIYESNKSMTAAEKAALSLAEGQRAVQKEAAAEMGVVSQAIGVLKNHTATQTERTAAIGLLLEKYPEYLKGIDLEHAGISKLDSIQKDLNESILRSIGYRQKANAVNGIYEKQAAAILRIEQLRQGGQATAGEAGLINTGDMIRHGGLAAAVIVKLQEQTKELGDEAVKTGQLFDKAFDLGNNQTDASGWYAQREKDEEALADAIKNRGAATLTAEEAAAAAAAAAKKAKDEFEELDKIIEQLEQTNEQAAKAETAERLRLEGDAAKYYADQMRELGAATSDVGALPMGTNVGDAGTLTTPENPGIVPDPLIEVNEGLAKNVALNQLVTETNDAVLGSIQQLAAQGETSMKAYGKAALKAAMDVAKARAIEGIFSAVSGALKNVPFPLNIAAAAAAAGISAALMNGLQNRIMPPKLAKGGLAYGPTMAMVGDNPGARSNPEVIAPLDKLQRIMSGGGGDMGGVLTTRISGDDLLFLVERTKNKRTRSRGY